MRYSERRKRNYVIAGLSLVLVMMAVGYAAFSSQLQINSTAGITSNWCLGFDSSKTNTYTASAGITGAAVPTAAMTYNGNVCGGSYNTGVTLSSAFKQPGDQVVYTLTIKNASSLDAKIDSITVDDTSVTSNQTITKGNIKFIIEMPESTSLSANASTTMKVTAKFQNDTDITGIYAGESNNVTVKINSSQDDGSGGFIPTTFVYAYHTERRTIGSSTATDGVLDYTELSSWKNGKTWFLKYELDENNIIQNAWACQKYSFMSEPVCLQGGDGSYDSANIAKINSLKSMYNSSSDGYCYAYVEDGFCNSRLQAGTYHEGSVFAYSNAKEEACGIGTTGAGCY